MTRTEPGPATIGHESEREVLRIDSRSELPRRDGLGRTIGFWARIDIDARFGVRIEDSVIEPGAGWLEKRETDGPR